jgi:RNA polymerase sigma-70 factor (ECF subfamily)
MIETRASRLEALVGTHFKSVWRLLHHFGVPAATVEDATQEVFLVATARIDEIAPGSERAFLFGTALRVAQAQRRNKGRETADDQIDEERGHGPDPEEAVGHKQKRELLIELLRGLEDTQREAFVLYEIEGLTIHEVAAVLAVPIGTAASRLRRAREAFEANLERYKKRWRGKP